MLYSTPLPKALGALGAMSNLLIEEAKTRQAAEICAVLRRSIKEICGPDYGNDETVLAEWLANKTPDNVSAWIQDPSCFSLVALINDNIVGFAHASKNEVLLNYALPEHLGEGVGYSMLAAIEKWAAKQGVAELKCVSTITALTFYKRQGFKASGEPEYVGEILGDFPLSKQLVI